MMTNHKDDNHASTRVRETMMRARHSSAAVRFNTPKTIERGVHDPIDTSELIIGANTTDTPMPTAAMPTTTAIHQATHNRGANKHTPQQQQQQQQHHHVTQARQEDTSHVLMSANKSTASVTFTPILTPNRSGDVVLLSPSRTITETLKNLATITGQQLEEVWDEVGYSPEDRAAQLSDLIVQFRDLCEAKISEEQAVAKEFHKEIAKAKNEIQNLSSALQQANPVDDANLTAQRATLADELAFLGVTLEDLRDAALEAQQELKECSEFLVDAHEALGIDMDPQWRDIDSNLTNTRQEQFREKRAELKLELTSRSDAMVSILKECQRIMRDLVIDTNSNECTELDRRIAGSLVRSKDDSFMMASKHGTETCVGISTQAMKEVQKRISTLNAEKRRRKEKVAEMGEKISILWEKLRIPEEEQLAFTDSVRGLALDTLRKGEAELDRLNKLKAEKIVQLVREAREEIRDLWEQIDADETYRNSFQALHMDNEEEYDDALLEEHESYLSELHARLEERKPIMRLIERREGIVKERMEYENLQKDPERLKQRSGALARQLMEEEKMARRIKRDLPKLTSILTEKLSEWKERHGEEFLYQASVYLEEIARQEQEWTAYKEHKHQKMLHKKHEENSANGTFGSKKNLYHRYAPKHTSRQPLGDVVKHTTKSRTATTRGAVPS